jgi:hypothetical protein
MTYAIATGCSHTAGVGNDITDCYVNYVEQHYQFPILNCATPGGGCNEVLLTIVDAVQRNPKPNFIVAQWPNIIRRPLWINGKKRLQTVNSSDDSFKILLKNGTENFSEPWIQSVIIANLLCKQASIPLINIMLESCEEQYLTRLLDANIKLHVDEKLLGRTWFFDSNAQDKIHHSPWCHQKWAERLIGIIDEYTAR